MTLDDAIDELFGVDLDMFVAERARLVKKLKDDGAKDDAAQLAKLRKPTVFAWTLNQLARRERRDIDLLLDAGHRLREAQAGMLRGGGDRVEFERAREIERDALRRLERAAARLLGGSSSAVLPQVSSTLRTAATSEEGRELLATGRFTAPLESEGFGSVAGLAPPAGRAKTPARTSAAEKQRTAKAALREAKARLRELEDVARKAEQHAEQLERESAKARRDADKARQAADDARRAL